MSITRKLAIALVTLLASMAFTTSASAQAGKACSGTVCGLGGQVRGQIGDGLPLPISIAPGYTGPFKGGTTPGGNNNARIKTGPPTFGGLPFVGQGLGQPGQVKPSSNATIMQTTMIPGSQGRAITIGTNIFTYGPSPQGSIGVINFNNAVFAVRTALVFDSPHPGTNGTGMSVSVPGGGGSRMVSRGLAGGGTINQGRVGLPTVSFYAGATANGSPNDNYGNATPNGAPIAIITAMAGDAAGINGVARFVATGNQFGGVSTGRTLGTAQVFFNGVGGGLNPAADLPCTGTAMCAFQFSQVPVATTGVAGGPFGGTANNSAFVTATGVFTGTIGFNGTIIGIGNAVTSAGMNIPFTGQAATSVGFPGTTGRLSITVTSMVPGDPSEMWVRTGTDARDANGNGVIASVSGSMSARNISKGNANRTWTTLEIPEPSALTGAAAGLLALLGCHQLVTRRKR
jgi:hypothetical protein